MNEIACGERTEVQNGAHTLEESNMEPGDRTRAETKAECAAHTSKNSVRRTGQLEEELMGVKNRRQFFIVFKIKNAFSRGQLLLKCPVPIVKGPQNKFKV